jgi:uncharacterized protein YhdP
MSRKASLPLAALLLAGCSHGAVARFNCANPVLLGPKDRVHGDVPLASTKTASFHAGMYKAFANRAVAGGGGGATSSLDVEADKATGDDPLVDIRLSHLEGTAWSTLFRGASAQESIAVGDVVRTGVKP